MILKIISQCDVEPIMTLPIKNIYNNLMFVGLYIQQPHFGRSRHTFTTSITACPARLTAIVANNFCLDLLNCCYIFYIYHPRIILKDMIWILHFFHLLWNLRSESWLKCFTSTLLIGSVCFYCVDQRVHDCYKY